MSKLRIHITMSLDGYVAGADQSIDDPLGKGGEALHEWAVATRSFREQHDLDGGEATADDEQVAAWHENVGATIMGRNMFGPVRGPWQNEEWRGWWGEDPPFHTPVFVLTHHARPPLEMEGGTTFHFVTDGIESASSGPSPRRKGRTSRSAAAPRPRSSTCARISSTSSPSMSCRSCSAAVSGCSTTSTGPRSGSSPRELEASPVVAHFRYSRTG